MREQGHRNYSGENKDDDNKRILGFFIVAGIFAFAIIFLNSKLQEQRGAAAKANNSAVSSSTNMPAINPTDPTQENQNAVLPPAPPSVSQPSVTRPTVLPRSAVQDMANTNFWVDTIQLNVRASPGGGGKPIEGQQLAMGDQIVANGSQEVSSNQGPQTWYRVNTGTAIGWVNARYLSSTPVSAPPPPQFTQPAPSNTAPLAGLNIFQRADSGWYVQAGASLSEADEGALRVRYDAAATCIGSPPRLFTSEAFVKTKQRGMILIAYGPYNSRTGALTFLTDLKQCIGDAFINEQPR
jgi:hypothetical protein